MATNTDKGHRQGPVKGRVQVQNPVTKRWIKIDKRSGRIVDVKKTPGPFKGIAKQ
jgi:hypothetical protein